jgi:FdrA protein
MPVLHHQLRRGAYCDSIVLLEVQKAMADLPGVLDAGAVMATEVNLALLAARDLLPPGLASTAPDDLLVAVLGESEAAAAGALAQVDALLARRRGGEGGEYRPRSLAAAVKLLPEARWVLVSVPGRWAARVAREALELGRHVFLFSDNVPLAEEVELKAEAARRGLLVLGPDCGTAIVGGVGFGFANRVRRGGVGLVAASGTGLQAVACRLHALGAGVSHALGTGGRDLSAEVGGATALQALDLLRRDRDTRVIVLLSKPPAAEVARRVLAAARATGKPVVVYFQGASAPERPGGRLRFAASLAETAELAVELLEPAERQAAGADDRGPQATAAGHGRGNGAGARGTGAGGSFLRGLFSGGTLAYEALLDLSPRVAPLRSNLKAAGVLPLPSLAASTAHTVLDLGDDAFTVGRLHPMMDPGLLLARLRQEAADPAVGAIVFDVVLGDGAHPDPASELAPAIAEVRALRPELAMVAIVVGTEEDPQGLAGQVERLAAAGAQVVTGVREAIERAAASVARREPSGEAPATRGEPTAEAPAARGEPAGPASGAAGGPADAAPVPPDALASPVAAINVGLETFHVSLLAQGAAAVQLDWRPPAGGDARLLALLDRMRSAPTGPGAGALARGSGRGSG